MCYNKAIKKKAKENTNMMGDTILMARIFGIGANSIFMLGTVHDLYRGYYDSVLPFLFALVMLVISVKLEEVQ